MNDYSQIYAHAYGSRPLIRLPRLLPWETVLVAEHEFALHYRRGRLIGQLPAGLHRLWGRHVQIVRLDRRRQLMEIPAQELPTADGVTVKVTAQITWQIIDPVAAPMGNPAPMPAAMGSSTRYTRRAPARSAEFSTARFSTAVMPVGTAITTRGRRPNIDRRGWALWIK